MLDVGGTGTLESLPYSLRQDSSAGEMLVDRVCAVLDGPLIRGRANVRSAGGRYRLSPGDTRVARRWIEEVMQLSASDWPEHLWYRVARFLSSLPIVAGRHDAIAIALGFVYGLEVSRIELRTNRLPIERSLATRLGTHNGRLGIDTVAGDGLLWPHSIAVTIGPVSLETYLEQRGWQAGRASLYALVVPAFVPGGVSERWVVEPRADGYRLGARDQAPLLGVSSYLS
ncbi:MAG: type VI secretion system baseplate subunit TssG [Gemmatimonadetes bacterium]|nr:type VI secretion system baseplate subunit TssG [Gemmatimonadota bacterium]